eukprot:TRINITY_DN11925_c0_g1_i1.p1 TRINITY_DN11925_c0_g1~~TRINITY_DN11925_c0_g1_i1.p1  ORF type:complete len:405 (-),score=82.59 TRINITY_DN11925_c0_g1_i1:722-1936(-)
MLTYREETDVGGTTCGVVDKEVLVKLDTSSVIHDVCSGGDVVEVEKTQTPKNTEFGGSQKKTDLVGTEGQKSKKSPDTESNTFQLGQNQDSEFCQILPDMFLYNPQFQYEEPQRTRYNLRACALTEQLPRTIMCSHANYVAFNTVGDPVVISLQAKEKNFSSFNGIKAILWLPNEVRRMIVPKPHCFVVEDALLFITTNIPSPPKCWKFTKVVDKKLYTGLCAIAKKLTWTNFKFGVLLAMPGMISEKELYENSNVTPDFVEFLEILGDKISLQGWTKFHGGLDVKKNWYGRHSYYTHFHGNQVMFHVGPMIPMITGDPSRKRHIGNDVVVIVFREDPRDLFDLSLVKSHFNHIFVIVDKLSRETISKILPELESVEPSRPDDTWYQVGIATLAGWYQMDLTNY